MADTFFEYWKANSDGPGAHQVTPYGNIDTPMRVQGMFLSVDFRYYFQPTRPEKERVPSYIRDRKKGKR